MLKYYSYYSVGGYKDMYLGSSEMKDNDTYYFPLLPIWRKRAEDNNDVQLEEKVSEISKLPEIKILNETNLYGLPTDANRIFSHGGYKILYTHAKSGEGVLAIRNIEGDAKDETGRPIPFLLVIVGRTKEDIRNLDKLVAYMSTHIITTTQRLSTLFVYDHKKNGLCFHLGELNEWVKKTITISSGIINTVQKEYIVDSTAANVTYLIIPDGLNLELSLKEQSLQRQKVVGIQINDILPLDNHQQLMAVVKRMVMQRKKEQYKDFYFWKFISGATIVGFAVGYILGSFSK